MFKKIMAIVLSSVIALNLLPLNFFEVYAAAGITLTPEARVTRVDYLKNHNGKATVGGEITIQGKGLKDFSVILTIGEETVPATLEVNSNILLKVKLSPKEAAEFNGEIIIGNDENSKVIDLKTNNVPSFLGLEPDAVNEDKNETLTITGANLNQIKDNPNVEAYYGVGLQKKFIVDNSATVQPDQSGYMKIEDKKIIMNPTSVTDYGHQNLFIKQEKNLTIDGETLPTRIKFNYNNYFRIIKSLELEKIEINPNAASKGDTIALTTIDGNGDNNAPLFNSAIKYGVYFLDEKDGDYAFKPEKKSPKVTISQDKKQLLVEIPKSKEFTIGTKRIVIVAERNLDVIARFDVEERFTLLDASNQPVITIVNPNRGSDEGAKLQLIGKNIFDIKVPGFDGGTTTGGAIAIKDVKAKNSKHDMEITYENETITYKEKPVKSLVRTIKVIIANQATFQIENNKPKYNQVLSDDYLYLKTAPVTNIKDDPKKDIVIEILTRVEMADGKVYNFKQKAVKLDGYEFLPNSIEPEVNTVNPERVQIETDKTVKGDTLISIKGKNFFVDKYTDAQGNVHVNYPVIAFQLTEMFGLTDADVYFDKNNKVIKDVSGIKQNANFEMIVLNDQNQVVDGSKGNNLGTRIVLVIPKGINVGSAGKKNVQVINTKRGSVNLGLGAVKTDILNFIISNDNPVIESVKPDIITIDSEEEIVITGSNFKEGAKVYIDGIDVGAVKRALSEEGDNTTLTFKAPVGREAETYLTVVNPEGGLASARFIYVKSNKQDPVINAITPNKGTTDTMTLIKGDNFLRPDPGANSTSGLGAFRLLGSRVLVDGKDVNQYNMDGEGHYKFLPYKVPDSNQALFSVLNDKLLVSPFIDNTTITSGDGRSVYRLAYSADGSPQLYDGTVPVYTFRYVNGQYQAFKADNSAAGTFQVQATSPGAINIPQQNVSFKYYMDNHILRGAYNLNRELSAELADYHQSVVLYDEVNKNYYCLQKLVDGTIKLTDGQNVYTIEAKGTDISDPQLTAYDNQSKAYPITQTEESLTLNGEKPLTLKFLTAYKFDSTTREITGNRIMISSKGKIYLKFPNLSTGTGLKSITVINPDTRSFTLKDGFYYYELPSTHPIISYLKPNFGSVAGGYVITIHGKAFSEGSEIYFDGTQVPKNNVKPSINGDYVEVKVPAYPVDISKVYGVGRITVPVTVVNRDGGSYTLKDGFTYIKPTSSPKITSIVLSEGSTNGGEVVEIMGTDFRFFEPYKNLGGSVAYEKGIDKFTNLNGYLPVPKTWDDLLAKREMNGVDLLEKKAMPNGESYFGYNYYYDSPILPKVFFGDTQAKIVEFENGYLKVITPPHSAGTVPVIVINNDAGTSPSVNYKYDASVPKIKSVVPQRGARFGGEQIEITGEDFMAGKYFAYQNNNASAPRSVENKMQVLLQFGNISNKDIAIGQENDGRINANRATVKLEGGLTVRYNGKEKTLKVDLVEGGKVYTRTFNGYDGSRVYLPTGMLKNGKIYYQPTGYGYKNVTTYNRNNDYELIEVAVDVDKHKLNVARGFSPNVILDSEEKITAKTSAYYAMGKVKITLTNPDGGTADVDYEYTNPSSKPIIIDAKPYKLVPAKSLENDTNEEQKFINASIQGGLVFRVSGKDFREGVVVKLGELKAEIIEVRQDGNNKQTLIVRAPQAEENLVDKKLPIIVENPDTGSANSANKDKLDSDKRLIFFVYRKPMSFPEIMEVIPNRVSELGGFELKIVGKDFREGAIVNLGDIDKITLKPKEIDKLGNYIKLTLPKNLSLGYKSIQVINDDFGTGSKEKALNVISAPELSNNIYTVDGDPVHKVYTEGGQKIILKGDRFMEGARVFFGGKRIQVAAGAKKEDLPEGEAGFYRDNTDFILEGGLPAASVKFIDKQTLEVVTPKMEEEIKLMLTVINPDTGITDGLVDIKYGVPTPERPYNLKVETVDQQYIKLYDYKVARTKYYEIFAYIGNKSMSALRINKYRDFMSLGTTIYEPYKLTNLAGVENLKSGERVYFVVKAVNEYGASRYSNIAYLTYDHIRKMDKFAMDNDGKIDDMGDKAYQSELRGQKLDISFTKAAYTLGTTLNFKARSYLGMNQIDMLIPDKLIAYNSSDMKLYSDFVDLKFKPSIFRTPLFNNHDTDNTEFINWTIDWKQNRETASALARLPRKIKAISPLIKYDCQMKTRITDYPMTNFAAPLGASFNLDSNKIVQKTGDYKVYYFNPQMRQWMEINSLYDKATNKVNYNVSTSGYFVLTSSY